MNEENKEQKPELVSIIIRSNVAEREEWRKEAEKQNMSLSDLIRKGVKLATTW